jgi:MinD superfamily P-loop ATPase
MKQIVVLSGKGGTGKTSIVACFAALESNAIVVDCDVDAPDLHLLLKPTIQKKKDFYGPKLASIDKDKCLGCGLCVEHCRFDAISEDFVVDPISCEGCGVCGIVCPAGAVNFTDKKAGEIYISDTRYGPMVHALLTPGEENSGKLVTMTRLFATMLAKDSGRSIIIIDGSPGIGCSVISSVTNVDFAVVVTEPTESGLHDLKRVIELIGFFHTKPLVVINKYDINENKAKEIEDFCSSNNIPLLGKIPFNPIVVNSMVNGETVVEYSEDSDVSITIKNIWKKLSQYMTRD